MRYPLEQNKLGVMPIKKLIWNMSLPVIASMLVQALYNIVDSMFVAQISQDALTAVGLAFPAQQLMIGLATGTAVGVNALMGRALGAGQRSRANKIACNGLFLAIACWVVTAILGVTLGNLLFDTQTQIQTIIDYGNDYIFWITVGSFALYGQVMVERLLQGTGRTVYSMYTQGLGAIINIILDPIFIFALDMGVAGAAIATVIGQCFGAGLGLYFNLKKNTDLTFSWKGLAPEWRIVSSIYAIGIPSVLIMGIGSVMTYLMNKILITFHGAHETAATAFATFSKLNSFVFMPMFGLNNGVVPIIAFNYGAQKRLRIEEAVRRSVTYAVCIMAAGTVIFLTVPHLLLKIFDANDELLAVGIPCLRIIALSFITAGICIPLGSVLQALGKSVYSMLTSLIRQLMVLLPAAYVLARIGVETGNSDLVWWCYPIAEIFAVTVAGIFYYRAHKQIIRPLPANGIAGENNEEQ